MVNEGLVARWNVLPLDHSYDPKQKLHDRISSVPFCGSGTRGGSGGDQTDILTVTAYHTRLQATREVFLRKILRVSEAPLFRLRVVSKFHYYVETTMENRHFGTSHLRVSAIGQGTWCGHRDQRAAAVAALREGLQFGMTHIDTAEMYLSGVAEEWVADAIAGRRDEVFLVSKVLPENASANGTIAACERSLARLGTDRLDCYLLHWRGSHPLAETIAAFEKLRQSGKILSWGVSNFDVEDLSEVHEIAGAGHPVCNQVLYHLQERAIEHAVIDWCRKNGTAVVAYSPFGHDRFPRPRSAGGKVLAEIASTHGATPRQVALRFLLRFHELFVIPKASKLEHVRENAGAGGLELSAAELARIDRAFPRGTRPASLPVL